MDSGFVNQEASSIGQRIARARAAAGLSQRQLAERAELSAMAVSKFERSLARPASATLARLAHALDTRIEFFLRPTTVQLPLPDYRKPASLSKKLLAKVEADIVDQVERFLELLSLFPAPPIPRLSLSSALPPQVESYDQIESIALSVREAWQLGQNAIPCLSDTLETYGLLVIATDAAASVSFDGLAATVGDWPVVAVATNRPGDRQRFTLAHELGHLTLGGRLSAELDVERACNRFAGAFLVPAPAIRQALGSRRSRLEARELYDLKHEFGISMGALVRRAEEAGIIDPHVKTAMLREFSSRGWRTVEPGEPVAAERPELFERLVLRALAEDMISVSKAAELTGVSTSTFRARLAFEQERGAADR